MLARRPTARRRGGVTIVEAALLLSIFLMFLFGVFEYCRYLTVLQVAGNAARDGARYATVNLDKPANFDFVDYTSNGKTWTNIRAHTKGKMATVGGMIEGLTVNTFPCSADAIYAYTANQTPTIVPKSDTTVTPNKVYVKPPEGATTVTRGISWKDAGFTERIAVEISGTYKPMFPLLLTLAPSSSITIVAVMGSEG